METAWLVIEETFLGMDPFGSLYNTIIPGRQWLTWSFLSFKLV